MEQALTEEATWRHLWSTYARPMAQTPEKTRPTNNGPDLSGNTNKEIEQLRKQNKQFQSERDQAVNKLNWQGKKEENEDAGGGAKRRRTVNLKPNAKVKKA